MIEVGETVAAALLEAEGGVSLEAARQWASDQFVYLWEEAWVVAGTSTDEIDGSVQLYLPVVAARIRDDADSFARLVATTLERWPEADYVIVRLPPGSNGPGDGFRLHSSYLSKRPDPRDASDAYEVRPPREAEIGFVHALLVDALLRGYRSTGREPEIDRARQYVESTFSFAEPSSSERVSCLVALSEGVPVGHATWFETSVDDVTRSSFSEIFDIYVLENFRRKGVTEALLNALEGMVSASGKRLLGHVVGEEDSGQQAVVDRLARGGWQPEYDLWVAAADDVRRARAPRLNRQR